MVIKVLNIDTFVGKTSGENGWEINKNTADGGAVTHMLLNTLITITGLVVMMAHIPGDEMSEYCGGDVVEPDNSENYWDFESGKDDLAGIEYYNTTDTNLMETLMIGNGATGSLGVVHMNKSFNGTKIASTIASVGGKFLMVVLLLMVQQ